MTNESLEDRLAVIGTRLSQLRPQAKDEQALFGFALGGLFALRQAVALGHVDRTGARLPNDYGDELVRVARDLASGPDTNERRWLATFFFNTAVLRLDAVGDRAVGQQKRAARSKSGRSHAKKADRSPIKADAGLLKHAPGGLLDGRDANPEEAVARLEALSLQLSGSLGNIGYHLSALPSSSGQIFSVRPSSHEGARPQRIVSELPRSVSVPSSFPAQVSTPVRGRTPTPIEAQASRGEARGS